jgi:hypothetical protein
MADDIETGKEKIYPIDDVIERVKNLVKDVELNDEDLT